MSLKGLDGLPKSDVIKFMLSGGSSVVMRPSGTEPKLKEYISITGESKEAVADIEARVCKDIEDIVYADDRLGYCCEW